LHKYNASGKRPRGNTGTARTETGKSRGRRRGQGLYFNDLSRKGQDKRSRLGPPPKEVMNVNPKDVCPRQKP